jgi:V-type H+-transporting ATPase subunit C
MKYRADKSLRELCDLISQEVNNIDGVMKSKQNQYTTVKSQLGALQRKGAGNLAVRSLAEVAKKEQFVNGSEYLSTLAVAVPKMQKLDWLNQYETLCQMIVPRSSQIIAEDEEYCLFTVTMFTRVVDEFTQKAREKRFVKGERLMVF